MTFQIKMAIQAFSSLQLKENSISCLIAKKVLDGGLGKEKNVRRWFGLGENERETR